MLAKFHRLWLKNEYVMYESWICIVTQFDEEWENCSFVPPRYILNIVFLGGYNSKTT